MRSKTSWVEIADLRMVQMAYKTAEDCVGIQRIVSNLVLIYDCLSLNLNYAGLI